MHSIRLLALFITLNLGPAWGQHTSTFPDASVEGNTQQTDDIFDKIFNGENINEALEIAVKVGVAAIPEVGELLGSLVEALWPSPTTDNSLVWSEIEKDVESIASGLLDADRTQRMRDMTEGLYGDMHLYLEQYTAAHHVKQGNREKGAYFAALLSQLTAALPYYFNDENPWENLAYFASMGTLYLTVLREQHLFYYDIWGHRDREATQHRRDLDNAVQQFLTARNMIVNQAINYHTSQLTIDYDEQDSGYFHANSLTYSDPVRDIEQHFAWSQSSNPIEGTRFAMRQKQWETWVSTGYQAQVEALLSPTFAWPLYSSNPRAGLATSNPLGVDEGQITNSTARRLMMDYPGWIGDGASLGLPTDEPFYFDHSDLFRQYGPLSKIIVHGGDRIDAIQLFYGGQEAPLRGAIGGDQVQTLELQPGEMITGLWANDGGGSIDALKFTSTDQRGKVVQTIQVAREDDIASNGWKYSFDGTGEGLQGDDAKRLLYFAGWSRTESDGGHIYRLLPVFGHFQTWGPLK